MDMEHIAQAHLQCAKYHWLELPSHVRLAWGQGVREVIERSGISPESLASAWLVHPDVIRYWLQIGNIWHTVNMKTALEYMASQSPISLARDLDELMGHAQSCTCRMNDETKWMLDRSMH